MKAKGEQRGGLKALDLPSLAIGVVFDEVGGGFRVWEGEGRGVPSEGLTGETDGDGAKENGFGEGTASFEIGERRIAALADRTGEDAVVIEIGIALDGIG